MNLLRFSNLITTLAIASVTTLVTSSVVAQQANRPLAILVTDSANQLATVESGLQQLNAEIWQMSPTGFVTEGNTATGIQVRSLDTPNSVSIIDGQTVLSRIPASRPIVIVGQAAGTTSIAQLLPLIERPVQLVALIDVPANGTIFPAGATASQIGTVLNYFQLPNLRSRAGNFSSQDQPCDSNFGCYQFEGNGDRPDATVWVQQDIINQFQVALNTPIAPVTTAPSTTENFPPNANNDSFELLANSTLTIPSPGFLSNDNDLNGDALNSPYTVRGAQNGTLQVFIDGAFEYTPNPDFVGTDSFVYAVSDGTDTAEAEVTLSIVPAPLQTLSAQDDSFEVTANTTFSLETPGLLANDPNPANQPIQVPGYDYSGANGQLIIFSNGGLQYTPNPGFVGTDSFTYTVSDGTDTAQAEVTLSVVAPLQTLSAQDDSFEVTANTTFSLETPGLLANDLNSANQPIQVPGYNYAGTNGQLVIFNNGGLQYTPNPGFVGTDSFTYTVSDGENQSEATVIFNVVPAN